MLIYNADLIWGTFPNFYWVKSAKFHTGVSNNGLLSRSYVYYSIWSVITADNFTSAKRDESFSAMLTGPYSGHEINILQHGL